MNLDRANEMRIAEIRRFQYVPTEVLRAQIFDLQERYGFYRLTTETYETLALDHLMRGALTVERLNPTNQLQRQAFPFMHSMLRDGILQLPSDGPNARHLLSEMKSFGYKVTDAGNVTYGGTEGAHDDIVYALCWALWGSQRRSFPPTWV